MEDKKTLFSAIQPSGILTIGNYLGALRNFKKLQDFIKELKSLNFESEYWANIIENFKRSFSIIERYGKDEDLLILENKGA